MRAGNGSVALALRLGADVDKDVARGHRREGGGRLEPLDAGSGLGEKDVDRDRAAAHSGRPATKSASFLGSRSGGPWPKRRSLGSSAATLRIERRFSAGSGVR